MPHVPRAVVIISDVDAPWLDEWPISALLIAENDIYASFECLLIAVAAK